MATIARSRITRQGQISVPAEVRRRLGVHAGSELEWEERNGGFLVRRAPEVNFSEAHKALFPSGPPKRQSLKQLKEGVGDYIRRRAASGRY